MQSRVNRHAGAPAAAVVRGQSAAEWRHISHGPSLAVHVAPCHFSPVPPNGLPQPARAAPHPCGIRHVGPRGVAAPRPARRRHVRRLRRAPSPVPSAVHLRALRPSARPPRRPRAASVGAGRDGCARPRRAALRLGPARRRVRLHRLPRPLRCERAGPHGVPAVPAHPLQRRGPAAPAGDGRPRPDRLLGRAPRPRPQRGRRAVRARGRGLGRGGRGCARLGPLAPPPSKPPSHPVPPAARPPAAPPCATATRL